MSEDIGDIIGTIAEQAEKSKAKKKAEKRRRRLLEQHKDLPLDADMSGQGWKKSLTWKYVTQGEDGKYYVDEYDFYVDRFESLCQCGTNKFRWLVPDRMLNLACTWCRTSETLSREAGYFRKRYEVTPEQAIEIYKSRGYNERDLPIRQILNYIVKKKPKNFRIPKVRPDTSH